MNRFAVLAACAALCAPAAAFAAGQQATEAPAATAVAPTTQPVQVKPRGERPVCKTIEEKGSRLGGKRVCRTQAEWNELSAQQRHEIERRIQLGGARQ